METTLKEIAILIKKGAVYLINVKIKITYKAVYIALLIILFGFIAIVIIAIFQPPPPGSYEEWIQEEWKEWIQGNP